MASKLQPCELSYSFKLPAASGIRYIDLGQCASFINRRLYRQGKDYYISNVVAVMPGGGMITLNTLPDSWVLSNAWKKSFSLWRQMQRSVLEDNPSVEGKWADYKLFFDAAHQQGGFGAAGPTLNMMPVDAAGVEVDQGEWFMSTFVNPQHGVVQATGLPLAADEFKGHMLGDDVAGGGSPDVLASAAIIKGYQDTRARVQIAPDVPADMSTNWMTQLTDVGGQDPELADVIEDMNDAPPYDLDEYPGGDGNFNGGVLQSLLFSTATLAVDKDLGFKVPLGLIKVAWQVDTYADTWIKFTLVPGKYKGLHCTDVSQ